MIIFEVRFIDYETKEKVLISNQKCFIPMVNDLVLISDASYKVKSRIASYKDEILIVYLKKINNGRGENKT